VNPDRYGFDEHDEAPYRNPVRGLVRRTRVANAGRVRRECS
jgi:hypothetical protein